jgi:replicative DNA helicase
MIDRIGLFEEVRNANDGGHNARRKVGAFLRDTANDLGITIIVFNQTNTDARRNQGMRPTKDNVYGGIGGGANCTKMVLIYRPETDDFDEFPYGPFKKRECKGKAELIVAYNTHGDTGSILVDFISDNQTFKEYSGDEWEDDDDVGHVAEVVDMKVHKAKNDLPF